MSTANSNLVRRVYIDDEDPSLIYRGPWTRYKNDFKDYQAFGTVFKGSQHRLSGESGSLIFRFKGTGSMAIFGTSNPLNNSGIYDPSYSCKLDGVNVPAEKPLGLPINLWPLCGTNATDAGDHVFELAASSDEGDFYVDQITYTPARASPPEGPNTVAIDQDDLAVRFLEGSWNADVGGMATTEAGAKMSVTFTGTSARFIGSVPMKQPQENSTATYSLDGGTRVTFDVPGLYGALLPRFGQPFFELKDLGPGTHELIVTYNGPAAPLMFDHLEVEGGDIFQSSLTGPTGGGGGGAKKKPVGAIVGGVVGGVVVLAILAILAFFWMKKRKQKKQAAVNAAIARPPIQPHSPLNSVYEVKPLVMEGQSPPTSFQSMPTTITGDSSLAQHTMQPMQPTPYMGHHQNFSTSSHPSSFPSNTNSRPTMDYQNHVVGPLAPARMSVAYTQQGPGYSRPPEPMA